MQRTELISCLDQQPNRYKKIGLFGPSKTLLWWTVQTDGWSFLDADLDNGRSCDGKVMLKIHPTLQIFLDVDRYKVTNNTYQNIYIYKSETGDKNR